MSKPVLVLGTRNRKKGIELQQLLEPFGLELRTLAEFPQAVEVEETGLTFRDNAALKACLQAKRLQAWVLGEDSGLCVPALGGAPGVFSARYSGPDATDEANNEKLLRELAGKTGVERDAFYVCHATLAAPDGTVRAETEGHCHGRLLTERHGQFGFGYDPLFEVLEYHQTFGELGLAVKGVISHRSRALRQMIPLIRLHLLSPEIK